MNSDAAPGKERMLQMLADRATEGLGPIGFKELNDLLAAHPEQDEYGFDFSAAAIDLAMMPPEDKPLPGRLRDQLDVQAARV